jgi:hypothetical protein
MRNILLLIILPLLFVIIFPIIVFEAIIIISNYSIQPIVFYIVGGITIGFLLGLFLFYYVSVVHRVFPRA